MELPTNNILHGNLMHARAGSQVARYSYKAGRRISLGSIARRISRLITGLSRINLPKPPRPWTGIKGALSPTGKIAGRGISMPVLKGILDSLSFKKLFLVWIGFIAGFGLIYAALAALSPGNGLSGFTPSSQADLLLNSVYFSFITATTTGFGDLAPLGLSKTVSVIEIILGMIMFGIVISKLVSFKQEVILNEIYDISFDERVNRMRSALYLFRSDIENLSHRLSEGKPSRSVTEHLWSKVNAMHETLVDIQKMICAPRSKNGLIKRVGHLQLELILNSVRLSLSKLNDLLGSLNSSQHNWRSEKNRESIRSVLSVIDNICSYHRVAGMPPSVMKRIKELELVKGETEKRLSA